MLIVHGRRRLFGQRHLWIMGCFVLLLTLAGLDWMSHSARADAGNLMRRLIGQLGKGGGHGTMAGGFVTIPKTAADGGRAIERMLALRFAAALKKNPERLAPIDLAKVEISAPAPPERQVS